MSIYEEIGREFEKWYQDKRSRIVISPFVSEELVRFMLYLDFKKNYLAKLSN
jgi:hypothetical protein